MKQMLAVAALVLSPVAQAQDVKQVDGFVSTYPASVISVDDVTVVEEFVDAESPLDSYLVLEFTGVYESHGEEDTVMVQAKRTDDGRPWSYESYKFELVSITASADPVPLGAGFITAISSPRPFKVQFKIKPNQWDGDTRYAEWNGTFSYRMYQPVFHEKSRGFSARLLWIEGNRKWVFHKVGFPFEP